MKIAELEIPGSPLKNRPKYMKSEVDEINESDENSSFTSINSSFHTKPNKIKIFNFNNVNEMKKSDDQ
jgi:hypothetical protein